jgi:hypothetical protein
MMIWHDWNPTKPQVSPDFDALALLAVLGRFRFWWGCFILLHLGAGWSTAAGCWRWKIDHGEGLSAGGSGSAVVVASGFTGSGCRHRIRCGW